MRIFGDMGVGQESWSRVLLIAFCRDRADFDGFLTGRDMFSSFMNGFVL